MKDKTSINRTLLAIGIAAVTIVVGFWLGYLLYQVVMT